MCTVHLVRHASVDGMTARLLGRIDVGLSALGVREAAEVARRCTELSIAAVFTSPRRRTRETAAAIGRAIERDVEVVEAFDEINYGRWTGKSFAVLAGDPAWRRFNDARHTASIPDGEPLEAVSLRIQRGLDDIGRRFPDGHVAVVTHAEIIRGALLLAASRSWASWAAFHAHPASVTPLVWGPFAPAQAPA